MKVETLPSGSKRVRVYVPAEKKYKSFTAKTGKEAQEKANEYLVLHKHAPGKAITVAEALDRYCTAKSSVLSPSTLRNYEKIKKCYFNDIGCIPLQSFTSEMAQIFVGKLAGSLSPKSVKNIYSLFSAARKMFEADLNLFPIKVNLPTKEKYRPYVLTDEDVRRLLEATKGTDLGMAIRLAIFIPARRSEICALNPKTDIIQDRFININKALVINNFGQWVISRTKTYESSRIVEMPPEILREFTHKLNFVPSQLTKAFSRAIKKLGIECRFHDLRHYGATFLHAQGVPDKYIMQRGGWSSVSTLQKIYTHTLPEITDEATSKVNEKFVSLTT